MNRGRGALGFLLLSAACFCRFATVRAAAVSSLPGAIYDAGATARALGMGDAYTAVAQDVTSLYYNPAGLSLMHSGQLSLLHAQLFDGAGYDYLAYGQNLRRHPGGWGVEVLRLGTGLAQGRDAVNNDTGGFGYSETGVGLGMGWRGIVLPEVAFGLKWKMLNRNLAGASDRLMGLDLGAQYGPLLDGRLTFGLSAQNSLAFASGGTDDRLQPRVRFGAGWRLIGPLMLAADVSSAGDFNIGTEYSFSVAALRLGMQTRGFSFGGGLKFGQSYMVDMAVVDNPVLGLAERFSLGMRFGGGRASREAFAREYLDNATAELAARRYVDASRDLDMALSIAPGLGEEGDWKGKANRLRTLIHDLHLVDRQDMQRVFQARSIQAALAHQAIMSFIEHDENRAMLFAHVAYGQDLREAAYQDLLNTLHSLTGLDIRRDDILPMNTFVARKLRDVVDGIYSRNFDSAVRGGRDAVTLTPNDETAWLRLGSAYFAAGDKVNAQAAYRNALKLDPGNDRLRKFMEEQGLQP